MKAPLSSSVADVLFMACGFPPAPTGNRNRCPVVMDGVVYPSIKAAAGFAGVSETGFSEALRKGKTKARGHEISYLE